MWNEIEWHVVEIGVAVDDHIGDGSKQHSVPLLLEINGIKIKHSVCCRMICSRVFGLLVIHKCHK